MNSGQINFFLHQYGKYIHLFILIYILYSAEIYPNSFIWWATMLNTLVLIYFIYIAGIRFGINQTIKLIAEQKAREQIEIEKNNISNN